MKIVKADFEKNPFIGLFLKASDRFILVPKSAPEKLVEIAVETLETEAIKLFVNQSHLLGLYCAMNSRGCVLPRTTEPEEIAILKKAGLNVCTVSDKFSAIGNNIAVNDKGALVNPDMSGNDCKAIADCLGVEVFRRKVAGFSTVGALTVATNRGVLTCNEASESDLELMEKCFGVKGGKGSSNMGTPFNSLGVIANSKGAVVGELTTGFEMGRVHEALA